MYNHHNDQPSHIETTCGSLLSELQKIWDEVGEPDVERDKMLLELEQECLEAYRRKVDQANRYRAQLRQAVADSEAELADLCAALGERPVHMRQLEKSTASLKKELESIMPQLEEMRRRKNERKREFVGIVDQIRNISKELCRSTDDNLFIVAIDETDLSLKRLEELQSQLTALQKEKADRLKQVLNHLNTLNSVCVVLGMDFKHTISEIHPTLDDSSSAKNLSIDTIERLSAAIFRLKKLKIQRMQRLQDLATTMVELWCLMDTPIQEQQEFQSVTRNIGASENDITEPNTLSLDFIDNAETEVLRLQQIKSSKMKDVLLKKKLDVEELCRRAHMVAETQIAIDYSIEAVESGAVDPSYLLEQIELQISKVKEEAFSRTDILEKVEKWLAACDEECWLEEYNRDDNRYNAGRGTHLILKRAEKARALVNKIPAMVETLTTKAKIWEKERGVEFSYDGVRLLSMLEQYSILKQEKEQECQRQRDQKKLQGQLIVEHETLFGSKPSPSKSGKKVSRPSTIGANNNRFSLGGAMLETLNAEKNYHSSYHLKKSNYVKEHNFRHHHHGGGFASLSSGKRNIDGTGLAMKKHSLNASNTCEIGLTPVRKPLFPVSSAVSSSNANTQNENRSQNGAPTSPFNGTAVGTRSEKIYAGDEEISTPTKMPIPIPPTPPTVSVAMQTSITPAIHCIPRGEDVEYSFEERRAGFVLHKTQC